MRQILFFIFFIICFADLYAQNDTAQQVIYREVYFDSDVATLSPAQKNKLLNTIDSLERSSINKIIITGHTDSIGSEAYNINLSKRRVEHVRQLLLEKNVSAAKITADHLGEARPAERNIEETGRARNRRVEVAIQYTKNIPPAAPPVVRDIKKGIIFGKVTDVVTGTPIIANLELIGEDQRAQTKSDVNGDYYFDYNKKDRFLIEANAEGYMYTSRYASAVTDFDSVRVDIELQPLEVGKKFEAKNIYFHPNLPDVVPSSVPEVNKLLTLMQQNENVKIEIQGHVNWPSTYPDQITPKIIQLSEDRARTVFEYLVSKGVLPTRMSFVGKGNSEMVIPDAVTMEEYRKNMRVEILILDM